MFYIFMHGAHAIIKNGKWVLLDDGSHGKLAGQQIDPEDQLRELLPTQYPTPNNPVSHFTHDVIVDTTKVDKTDKELIGVLKYFGYKEEDEKSLKAALKRYGEAILWKTGMKEQNDFYSHNLSLEELRNSRLTDPEVAFRAIQSKVFPQIYYAFAYALDDGDKSPIKTYRVAEIRRINP